MYLGNKVKNLTAVDNGVVAALSPETEPEALFVPEAWGNEAVQEPIAIGSTAEKDSAVPAG